MEKNLKEIITKYSNTEDQNDNCYKGLFWDLETSKFLRWNELKKESK
jgi:hypothetical protein|tara:strand:- start:1113 stop:1253 length:141 start_codon:yes stop_codon:yes gene_type:complete